MEKDGERTHRGKGEKPALPPSQGGGTVGTLAGQPQDRVMHSAMAAALILLIIH